MTSRSCTAAAILAVVLATLLLLSPQRVPAEDPQEDAQLILGHWQVIRSTYQGKPLPETLAASTRSRQTARWPC
jgi:hypothetical protein